MLEIAALIKKAAATTNQAVETAERQKQLKLFKQVKPIVEEPESSPDKPNILADLDRIINNLELQKNMATFGTEP